MFRNIRFYRVHGPWPASEKDLSDNLSKQEFSPCGRFSERSGGWEAPSGKESGSLCRHLAGADLLQLRTQSRVLPAAAVKEALEGRVQEYRERTQLEPSPREIRELKMETRDELKSRSLLKSDRTQGFYLHQERILGVDAHLLSKDVSVPSYVRHAVDGQQVEADEPRNGEEEANFHAESLTISCRWE